jgi:hypothetical protein
MTFASKDGQMQRFSGERFIVLDFTWPFVTSKSLASGIGVVSPERIVMPLVLALCRVPKLEPRI